uniref:Immunoglobulin domain-containing protein n=1 Tax=Melopsittacus undulatus TaxID=13146 RepID=A0A8C6IN11_MELUD
MEPALLLLLGLLWGCRGESMGRLVVTPQEPVVPYGGSVQLNCSLHACAEGTVQWKGLDTNLGSVTSFPTHSILHVSSAVVAMGGTKICQGACHGQYYQRTVKLRVYGKRSPAHPSPGACGATSHGLTLEFLPQHCRRGCSWRQPPDEARVLLCSQLRWWPQGPLAQLRPPQSRASPRTVPPQRRSLMLPPSILLPEPPQAGSIRSPSPRCPAPARPRCSGWIQPRARCPPAACGSGRCLPPGRGAGSCASSAGLSVQATPPCAGCGPRWPSRSTGRRRRAAAPRCGWTAPSPGTRATTNASCSDPAPVRPVCTSRCWTVRGALQTPPARPVERVWAAAPCVSAAFGSVGT